jgi:predicted ATPase/DNA-binding XRE family transcriptional regulator
MKADPPGSFGAQLKALREAAGFTQEELATIAGLSVHGVSALERGERQRPHVETVRALSAALDLTGEARDAFLRRARVTADDAAVDELASGSLPLPPTALLGRDTDLQTLRRWLADRSVRLITLTGPGGAGKTRLALEITHAVASERTARVVFVSLAATRNPAQVAPVIAEALGLSDVSAGDLPMRARAVCGDRPTMLVLDNFEQVLDAAPLVTGMLTSVASLRALITSRAPLRVRGEREYVVGPLELETGSEEMPPADLARAPAVRLFLERVRDVQPDFRLTPANGPTITAICRRLDALPLALELAAPWLKVLPVEDLLRRLERDVLLSTIGPRDLPERQQTMNATVAWSYQLLDPDEQRAFRRFGALPGLFPIDAAAAVLAGGACGATETDDALRATARLIDKSLLQRAETSVVATCPMYQMLETVRAYAAGELVAAGERDGAMEGLVHYCAAEAALAAKGLVGPEQVTWLDRVREDLESYRSAMAWLIEGGRPTEACDIAWSLMFFWLIRGHAAEGLRWYEQTLALPSLTPVGESRARLGAAVMLYTQGQYERSRSEVMRALALAENAADTDLVAQAEHLLGHLEYAASNLDAADRRFARSVEGFRRVAVPWGTGHALSGMAAVALATGDAAQAERLLDDAASALHDAGPWFMSLSLYIRAIAAVRGGNPDRAIALVGESLAHIRELHDKFALVYSLVPLAAAAVLKGDDAWAARVLGTRDAVMERTGVAIVDALVYDLREQAEQEARRHLSPDGWASAYAVGRRSSIDALQKDIDVARRGAATRESANAPRGRHERALREQS